MSAEQANPTRPTPDERVTAALAHAATLLPMMGALASIVIWATQKDRSRYVAFQALQAAVYQIGMVGGAPRRRLLHVLDLRVSAVVAC